MGSGNRLLLCLMVHNLKLPSMKSSQNDLNEQVES
jgi:hypothetical protein